MVEDEKRRYRPSKNYLEHLAPLNISAFEVIFETFITVQLNLYPNIVRVKLGF